MNSKLFAFNKIIKDAKSKQHLYQLLVDYIQKSSKSVIVTLAYKNKLQAVSFTSHIEKGTDFDLAAKHLMKQKAGVVKIKRQSLPPFAYVSDNLNDYKLLIMKAKNLSADEELEAYLFCQQAELAIRAYKNNKINFKKHAVKFSVAAILLLSAFIQIPVAVVAKSEVVSNHDTAITSAITGIIDTVNVEPGDIIKKGSVIFTLNKDDLLAERNAAFAKYQKAKIELMKSQRKSLNDVEAREKVEELKKTIISLKSEYELANLRLEKANILAPFDGQVIMDNENLTGLSVSSGEQIIRLVDPKDLAIKFKINQNDYAGFTKNSNGYFVSTSNPDLAFETTLKSISLLPISDANESFFEGIMLLKKQDGLILGESGVLKLQSNKKESILYSLIRKPLATIRATLGV